MDVTEVEYGLRRPGMCTRFLPRAGPSRQPAKKISCGRCSTVLAHGLPLNRGSSMKSLLQYRCHRLMLESPENRLQDSHQESGYRVASSWPTSRSTRAQSKMKERPLVRHRSDVLLLLGAIKEKPREIPPAHYETDFSEVLFHITLRMRMLGFILAG